MSLQLKSDNLHELLNLPENTGKIFIIKDIFGQWEISENGAQLTRYHSTINAEPIRSYYAALCYNKISYLMVNGHIFDLWIDNDNIAISVGNFLTKCKNFGWK